MKLKEKLILSGIILIVGSIFSLFFTAAIHGLLSRQHEALTLIPFSECVKKGLFTQKQQLLLFLSFEGFIALCCMLFFVQNNRPYQSQLINVTEDIQTPAPVGQFQHGSSRWLREKEKPKVFNLFVLDPGDKVIKGLIDIGYDGLDFLKEEKLNTSETVAAAPSADEPTPVSIKARVKEALQDDSFETVADFSAAAALKEPEPQKEPAAIAVKPPEKDRHKLLKEGGIVIGMTKDCES